MATCERLPLRQYKIIGVSLEKSFRTLAPANNSDGGILIDPSTCPVEYSAGSLTSIINGFTITTYYIKVGLALGKRPIKLVGRKKG